MTTKARKATAKAVTEEKPEIKAVCKNAQCQEFNVEKPLAESLLTNPNDPDEFVFIHCGECQMFCEVVNDPRTVDEDKAE